MIIGSGLLARAFAPHAAAPDLWIYAAGVSNSACTDNREFERERSRLAEALRGGAGAQAFVYFSTCSADDPDAAASAYVRHKLAMERLVASHPAHIVVRLPQVAGRTPNPHTLLNYLHARIVRSERFTLRAHATRNVIDIDDAVAIVMRLLRDPARRYTVNVAAPESQPVPLIVEAMEAATGKVAIAERLASGAAYEIDTARIRPVVAELGLSFGRDYVFRVIRKYYGPAGAP